MRDASSLDARETNLIPGQLDPRAEKAKDSLRKEKGWPG